jgi:hypothetical protein
MRATGKPRQRWAIASAALHMDLDLAILKKKFTKNRING